MSTALGSAIEVVPAGPLRGALAAPGSKSVTNRLLVIATLAEGASRLGSPLESDDSQAMLGIVRGLGAAVDEADASWTVHGTSGALQVPAAPLDARLSGTTMRFGMALAALAPAPVVLDGQPPLRRRPIGALTAALAALGADVADDDGFPPVTVGGGMRGGQVTIDVSRSSQYASAVLLAAPYAARDVAITVAGETAAAYVALTVEAMRGWGAAVDETADGYQVTAGRHYGARDVGVEYDASAAAHLWGLAAATGGAVTVVNAVAGTLQPDAGILDVLSAMGCEVARNGDAVTVTGPADGLRPVPGGLDLAAMPDQVTTVAALAALARGTTPIRNVGVARGHETDRLAALARELSRLGVQVEELPDGLVVHGGDAAGPARLDTYDDHRLAMAFGVVGATVPRVVISDPGCVAKTFPGFWSALADLGGGWLPV